MERVQDDVRDDERERGAEHPDRVLKGEEEHPLRPPLQEIDLDELVDPANW